MHGTEVVLYVYIQLLNTQLIFSSTLPLWAHHFPLTPGMWHRTMPFSTQVPLVKKMKKWTNSFLMEIISSNYNIKIRL